ncbi:MAG: tRNA pseudouridine(38-40) synthase TruA [Clostridia bacterium]|nr:tRNA pseudouridine(38-40) synthase TruA [Clostridia bacterium]
MRIKLTIQYDGSAFCGWQSQPNGNAIQDHVERALATFLGGKQVRIYGAGRTDVGVHAIAQVAHFDTDKRVNPFKLCLGVNLALPSGIAVTNAEIVEDAFDARFGATSKTYRYSLYVSPTRMPLLDATRCQLYTMPNVDLMQKCADMLTGTHDFAAFQKAGSNTNGTVRTIHAINVAVDGSNIDVVVNGNAFLYNMVRIIAGTLVAVGYGKISLSDVQAMLDSGKRKTGIKTLASKGLTLVEVLY